MKNDRKSDIKYDHNLYYLLCDVIEYLKIVMKFSNTLLPCYGVHRLRCILARDLLGLDSTIRVRAYNP